MKNEVLWKDAVLINGLWVLEVFPVDFENEYLNDVQFGDNEEDILKQLLEFENNGKYIEPLYDCDKFFSSVKEKYNLKEEDEVITYMFNDVDEEIESSISKDIDIAWLGGYINGVNI